MKAGFSFNILIHINALLPLRLKIYNTIYNTILNTIKDPHRFAVQEGDARMMPGASWLGQKINVVPV